MIRSITKNDLEDVNNLLIPFNYYLNEESFKNEFLRVLLYDDSQIMGVLVYDLIYDRIEIEYIIVDSKNRRKGIASKLLNYLLCENKEIKNISLEVKKSNEAAIKFYEKNGFEKVAVRKRYYGDEDGLLMVKKVGE